MGQVNIEGFNPKRCVSTVHDLWMSTLGNSWPISVDVLANTILGDETNHTSCFAAWENEQLVGFAATAMKQKLGSIICLLVAQSHQGRGIGTALLGASESCFRDHNVHLIQLGSGTSLYFWPGVPANLPMAVTFFENRGWQFEESSFDLVQDLSTYSTPQFVFDRIEKRDLRLRTAVPGDAARVLAFEKEHFPQWYPFYEAAVTGHRLSEILVAFGPEDEVLGTLLVEKRKSKWHLLLGRQTGEIGAVGVAAKHRRQGIGLALVARGTELLKARGASTALIGWTWLINWYGKLGYKVWREYKMGRRYDKGASQETR